MMIAPHGCEFVRACSLQLHLLYAFERIAEFISQNSPVWPQVKCLISVQSVVVDDT